MPLYEYQCDACGHRFEVIQKYSDQPIDVCPKCGGSVTKLISSPAIQFKGTGWYITDYARKGQSGDGSGRKSAESASPDKSDTSDKSHKSGSSDKSATSDKSSPASDSSSSGSSAATPAASSSKDS